LVSVRNYFGLADVFYRVVFGVNRNTGPSALSGRAIVGNPLLYASLLIQLSKAEFSAGKITECFSHLSVAVELLEIALKLTDPSVNYVYSRYFSAVVGRF
jgi:hypothetical protein